MLSIIGVDEAECVEITLSGAARRPYRLREGHNTLYLYRRFVCVCVCNIPL